jgi:hypothetical protein
LLSSSLAELQNRIEYNSDLLSSIYTNQKRKKLPPSNHTEGMEHSSGSHPHTNTHGGEPMIIDTGSEVHANIDVPEDVHGEEHATTKQIRTMEHEYNLNVRKHNSPT